MSLVINNIMSKSSRREVVTGLAAAGAAFLTSSNTGGDSTDNKLNSKSTTSQKDAVWRMFRRDLENSGRADSRIPDREVDPVTQTSGGFNNGSHFLTNQDTMYLAEFGAANIEAFERESGNRVWQFSPDSRIGRPPALSEGFLYASDLNGNAYAIDQNGNSVHETQLSAISETVPVNGNILFLGSTGQVEYFDEKLTENSIYEKPGEVNIGSGVTTVNDSNQVIYVERRQGGSPDTHLRMLDLPDDPSQTDSLDLVDKVPVGGEAEDGATFYSEDGVGNYVWNEGSELKVAEVLENGFGSVSGIDVGSFEGAPVVIDGEVWAGTDDGNVYRVALEDIKSDGPAEVETVSDEDEFDTGIYNIVAGENTVAVSSDMGKTVAYDVFTDDKVNTYADPSEDVYRRPVAIDDGKLFVKTLDGSKWKIEVLDGEYRDIVPDLSFGGFDPGSGVVFGRSVSPVVDASARDEELTGFGLSVFEGGEEVFSGSYGSLSDLESVDLSEVLDGEGSYSVEVSVTDAGGDTASESMSLDLTGLGLGLSVDGPDYGNESYSVSADASNGDWDSLDWFLDGQQVGSGETVDVFDLLDSRGSYEVQAEADVGSETYQSTREIDFQPEKPGIVDTGFDWSEELGETPNTGDSIEVYADITETEAESESVTYNLMYVDSENPEAGFTQVASKEVSSGSWDVSDEINRDGLYMVETVVEDEYGDTVREGSSDVLVGPEVSATGRPAQDLDGDGRYDDVNGDGETNILDTQALFNNLDESSVQSNQRYFDFGAGPDTEVSILDVAGHWLDVTGG